MLHGKGRALNDGFRLLVDQLVTYTTDTLMNLFRTENVRSIGIKW